METQQIDLTKMNEVELLKFIIAQQEQQTQFIVALNQIATNINNAKAQLDKIENSKPTGVSND